MKNPNIKIHFNPYLDKIFKEWILSQPKYKNWVVPSSRQVERKVKEFNEAWDKDGSRILSGICEATGLKFKRNHFTIHIVSGNPRSYSDPIVISSTRTPAQFVETLAHELIHCLMVDNKDSDFVQGADLLADHVAIYAILRSVLPRSVVQVSDDPTNVKYIEAKKAVKRVGYKSILRSLR